MTEVGWSGEERRDGGERRARFEQWAAEERRMGERRRGGIGTHHPDPTERMLHGIHLPETLAFEPAAGTTGDRMPEETIIGDQVAAAAAGDLPVQDASHAPDAGAGLGRLPFASERAAIGRSLVPDHQPHDAIPSTAAIAGHPLHPAVVPLPIGALTGALAADIAYAVTKDPFFARAARLLTLTGLITGAVAGVLGGIDFWTRGQVRSHRAAWLHAGGNALTLLLGGVSLGLRAKDERMAAKGPGLVLSAVSGIVLLVTGWLGGELSYRHRVGVTEREHEEPADG